jgi:hypothetical protein
MHVDLYDGANTTVETVAGDAVASSPWVKPLSTP